MTTLKPREPYSEDELLSLYPSALQLEQVQVLLRHGERTPVNARFKNAGLPPYWPYCNAAQLMRSVILSPNGEWDHMTFKRKLESFGSQDDTATLATAADGEREGICLPGELTDVGRRTTLSLGTRLRHLYIERLKFLPNELSQQVQSQLYVRATPMPRALESVQQAFTGLYPISKRSHGLPHLDIITRQPADETLFPNEGGCKRFSQLAVAFGERAAHIWNDSPELKYVTSRIGKWMPPDSPAVKVDAHPRLSGVMDTINATLAHASPTRLPAEFYDPQSLANIDKVAVDEWFTGYKQSTEYRRLGIGALVGDITARMVDRIRATRMQSSVPSPSDSPATSLPRPDIRFGLSGCHDTTLAAILSSLGAFDGEAWPPYTSHIAIELFRDRKTMLSSVPAPTVQQSLWQRIFGSAPSLLTPGPTSSRAPLDDTIRAEAEGFFVRLRYNDKIMSVPGCRPQGKHFADDESMCTFAAFKEIVDKFTPRNWKAECGANLGQPAVLEQVEEAGY